eukprot:4061140-Karenia_brevis.AAC.1
MGLDVNILRPLEAMYGSLKRRFRFSSGVGAEFSDTNGILQGCPLSIILLNALVSVWARALDSEVPSAMSYAFADDTVVTVKARRFVQPASNSTREFAEFTGQQLSAKKSFAVTTVAGIRHRVKLGDEQISWLERGKCVGVQLAFQGQRDPEKDEERLKTAGARALRVGTLPIGFDGRSFVLQVGVMPIRLHGTAIH